MPLRTLRSALLLATARRTLRSGPPLPPVRTLHYFLPAIEEVLQLPPDPGYVEYLAAKLKLSTLLGTPPTTLSSQLVRLQRRKEIKRRRNPDDGRSSLIELTKQGEKNVLAAMPALRESVARVSEHLDYSIEELDFALDRLEDALRTAVSRPDESVRPAVRGSRR